MTRAWMEFLALDRVEASTEDGVDDASTVDANGRRKFFGERLEGWSRLDEGGEIRASFRGAREGWTRAEAWFECDVAMARSRARLWSKRTAAGRDAAEATTREGEEDENGERTVEVTCAFDGVDVESVVRHDALNVGAFVVTLKTCLLYTSPSPRDLSTSRMPSSA